MSSAIRGIRQALGKCTRCGKEPVPGRTMCGYRQERQAEWSKAKYDRKKAKGICIHCSKAAITGKTMCAECARKTSQWCKALYWRKKEAA